jgi:hypothetical protein
MAVPISLILNELLASDELGSALALSLSVSQQQGYIRVEREMEKRAMKWLKVVGAGAGVLLLSAQSVSAATYQIQLGGLNLIYAQSTGLITDSGGTVAGGGAVSDDINTASYLLDGTQVLLQGSPNPFLEFDARLYLAAGTDPTVNATSSLIAGAFPLFDFLINGAPGLFTDVTVGSITFTNGSINMLGSGFSTIFDQNLPLGWVATNPINWSFSSGTGTCTGTAGSLVCSYSGTGELSWVTAPEPAALALFGTALLGFAARRRRRA